MTDSQKLEKDLSIDGKEDGGLTAAWREESAKWPVEIVEIFTAAFDRALFGADPSGIYNQIIEAIAAELESNESFLNEMLPQAGGSGR